MFGAGSVKSTTIANPAAPSIVDELVTCRSDSVRPLVNPPTTIEGQDKIPAEPGDDRHASSSQYEHSTVRGSDAVAASVAAFLLPVS